jgi:hypothetical protein
VIVDHYNKNRSAGNGLARIAQAGMAQFADSWVLQSHETPPNVQAGAFHLVLDVGSRQWGGASWSVHFDIGMFDEETAEHQGQIVWSVLRRALLAPGGKPGGDKIQIRRRCLRSWTTTHSS